ncbi:unnamed protein product [Gongylonema pulchrum]|uniref:Uncharacterized protein n=1 Tax=Gongylonema pulchrum TaxID=637853 RepID=A0A183CUX1_9BILA|nr:unnamed protein product [Gongylonema pulchrum]
MEPNELESTNGDDPVKASAATVLDTVASIADEGTQKIKAVRDTMVEKCLEKIVEAKAELDTLKKETDKTSFVKLEEIKQATELDFAGALNKGKKEFGEFTEDVCGKVSDKIDQEVTEIGAKLEETEAHLDEFVKELGKTHSGTVTELGRKSEITKKLGEAKSRFDDNIKEIVGAVSGNIGEFEQSKREDNDKFSLFSRGAEEAPTEAPKSFGELREEDDGLAVESLDEGEAELMELKKKAAEEKKGIQDNLGSISGSLKDVASESSRKIGEKVDESEEYFNKTFGDAHYNEQPKDLSNLPHLSSTEKSMPEIKNLPELEQSWPAEGDFASTGNVFKEFDSPGSFSENVNKSREFLKENKHENQTEKAHKKMKHDQACLGDASIFIPGFQSGNLYSPNERKIVADEHVSGTDVAGSEEVRGKSKDHEECFTDLRLEHESDAAVDSARKELFDSFPGEASSKLDSENKLPKQNIYHEHKEKVVHEHMGGIYIKEGEGMGEEKGGDFEKTSGGLQLQQGLNEDKPSDAVNKTLNELLDDISQKVQEKGKESLNEEIQRSEKDGGVVGENLGHNYAQEIKESEERKEVSCSEKSCRDFLTEARPDQIGSKQDFLGEADFGGLQRTIKDVFNRNVEKTGQDVVEEKLSGTQWLQGELPGVEKVPPEGENILEPVGFQSSHAPEVQCDQWLPSTKLEDFVSGKVGDVDKILEEALNVQKKSDLPSATHDSITLEEAGGVDQATGTKASTFQHILKINFRAT